MFCTSTFSVSSYHITQSLRVDDTREYSSFKLDLILAEEEKVIKLQGKYPSKAGSLLSFPRKEGGRRLQYQEKKILEYIRNIIELGEITKILFFF